MESVFARVFSLTPKAARKELGDTFGEQLERWTHQAGVRVVDLATALGFERPHAYKLFRGALPFHAAWLYLLPPALLKLVLDDLAASIGHEVRPASDDALPRDYCHARDGADYIRELTDCLRERALNEADGQLDLAEIERELRELEEAEAALARRRAFLQRAKRERGGTIHSLVRRIVESPA